MELITAARALTRYLEENLPEWAKAQEGSPELTEIYAQANSVLDPDRRIITHETLDDLFAAFSTAYSAESNQGSHPAGSPRKEAAALRSVHDYTDDLNLALLRAGYRGSTAVADSLDDLTVWS